MKLILLVSSAALVFMLGLSGAANASVINIFYGDDDGFGVGEVTGNLTNPDTSHDWGDAVATDIRLIGNGYAWPAFAPTGSFGSFVLGGPVIAASLTMRVGALDSGPNSLDGQNKIMLDGLTVPATFINGFSTLNSQLIETRSFLLPASFFSIFADGSVNLAGTHISEGPGAGSFQIDFLRIDIETSVQTHQVPEPGALALFAFGLLGLGLARRRKTA